MSHEGRESAGCSIKSELRVGLVSDGANGLFSCDEYSTTALRLRSVSRRIINAVGMTMRKVAAEMSPEGVMAGAEPFDRGACRLR